VPYQTLIASVLHKYVTGRLREARAAKDSQGGTTKRRPARRSNGPRA
jgi:hypothetical protein